MLSFVTIAWASLIAASVSAFNHQTHFHGTPPAVVPIPPISAERGHWVRDLAERWDLGNLGVVGVRAGSKGEWTFVSMITHGNRSLDEDGPLHENVRFVQAGPNQADDAAHFCYCVKLQGYHWDRSVSAHGGSGAGGPDTAKWRDA